MSFLFPAFVNLNYYYLYYELLKSSVWNFSFIRLIIVHSFFTLHVLKNFINVFIFLICVILLLKALRYWRAGFRFLIEVLAKCMLNPLLYWVFLKALIVITVFIMKILLVRRCVFKCLNVVCTQYLLAWVAAVPNLSALYWSVEVLIETIFIIAGTSVIFFNRRLDLSRRRRQWIVNILCHLRSKWSWCCFYIPHKYSFICTWMD